jgi:hypothetical protein
MLEAEVIALVLQRDGFDSDAWWRFVTGEPTSFKPTLQDLPHLVRYALRKLAAAGMVGNMRDPEHGSWMYATPDVTAADFMPRLDAYLAAKMVENANA